MVGGRGMQVLATYAVFAGLTTVAIALRVYTRVVIVRKFGLDDWFAVLAWVYITWPLIHREANNEQAVFIPCCAFAIEGCQHGTGVHVWDIIPLSELPIGLKASSSHLRPNNLLTPTVLVAL